MVRFGMLDKRPIAFGCTALLAVTVACSSPDPRALPAQSPAPMSSLTPVSSQSDPATSDLPPLPPGVENAVRSPDVVRAVYRFAAEHPEVLHFVPCFCGCERGGHKDNDDCFIAKRNAQGHVAQWESHALGCEICIDVAQQAMQMHNAGASVSAIRDAIEKKYAGIRDGHTPTPMPSHGHGSSPRH
jgi:hypothetical protein